MIPLDGLLKHQNPARYNNLPYMPEGEMVGTADSPLNFQRYKGPFTNTCYGVPDASSGGLKICDPCEGDLEKITTNFPVKIEFTYFSMGLIRNFYGKNGGVEVLKLFEVRRGPEKKNCKKIFCISPPPYKCL